MKELIGKRIDEIYLSDDQSILQFKTDKGDVIYETWGDCCSETWFADIVGYNSLNKGIVQSTERVEMEAIDDGRTRQEYDEIYCVKITTDKGHADIIFRNSSNGYYGGDISYIQTLPDYDKEFVKQPLRMKKVIDDYSA